MSPAVWDEVVFLMYVLLLANFVFYSSVEIFPLLDVSLAIYLVLSAHLGMLAYKLRPSWSSLRRTPLLLPMTLFLGAVAVSVLSAEHVKDVIYFFVINALAFVLFFITYHLVKSRALVHRFVKWTFWFGVLSAVVAVWQLYSNSYKEYYYPFLDIRDQKILELWEVVSRMVGTWQHPSYLGIFLAITAVLGVHIYFQKKSNLLNKILVFSGTILIVATVLLTNTRSSVLTLILGLGLYSVTALFKGSYDRQERVRRWFSLGALGVIAILLYQFVFVAEIYTKPQAWRVDASATVWGRFLRSDSMSSESLVQRSQLYSLALEKFRQKPITGIGGKNFPYEVEGLFERGTDAHNVLLQTAAETGFVGIIATTWLYASLLTLLYRRWRLATAENSGSGRVFLAIVIAFMILFDSMFNNPLYSMRILGVFWIFSALALLELRGGGSKKTMIRITKKTTVYG